MSQIVNQIQFKRSDKTLADLSSTKLKYGEPVLLTNSDNRALVIGNSSENDALSNEYFIPLETKDTLDKGYMIRGVDYVTAGQKSGSTLGQKSTVEGNDTTASGSYSHAEGDNTVASGLSSHAEGDHTTASAPYSHSEGLQTHANHRSQHVFGEYNVVDASTSDATARGNYIEIVGNGTANNVLSNARTLDWNGNEILAGKLTIGAAPTANMDVTTKQYVDTAIAGTAGGTVTSVRVQATSPVQSSTSTAQTTSLNTTISLADSYGDTKNPYASKTKNYVLAAPNGSAGAPSFRALVADDIPSITKSKISDFPTSMTPTAHNHAAGDINSGTLGVARGGTGAASFTANCVIMSNTTTTGALTTRAVVNNTSSTALTNNTSITTQNTVYYGLNNRLNRSTALNAADTGYTTCMARGESLHNAETNPSVNGAIAWFYQ